MKVLAAILVAALSYTASAQEAVSVLNGSNFDENGRLKLKSSMDVTFTDNQNRSQTTKVPVEKFVNFIAGGGISKGVNGSWGDFMLGTDADVEKGREVGLGGQFLGGTQFVFHSKDGNGIAITAQAAKHVDGFVNMNGYDISVGYHDRDYSGDANVFGGYFTDLRGHCRADNCFGKKGSQKAAGLQIGGDLMSDSSAGILVFLRFGVGWGDNFARYLETRGVDDKKRADFQASLNWMLRLGHSSREN